MSTATNRDHHKIGVLLSAGGAAFGRAFALSGLGPERFHVIVDRPCGAIEMARTAAISVSEIAEPDREIFSQRALEGFRDAGCTCIVMLFSRLVSRHLFDNILTLNVHPALLPAFPGLDGVGDAFKAGSPYQGASLHLVDAGIDSGPVLAQTVHAVPQGADLAWRNRLGFVQKAIVTMLLFDWIASGRLNVARTGRDAFDLLDLPPGAWWNPGFATARLETAATHLLREAVSIRV